MKGQKSHIVLSTHDLSIGYKSKKKLTQIGAQINLDFNKGELIGLVGANGIGKSTLLRTLTKVQPRLSGEINIEATDLNDFNPTELAKVLSVVLTESIASKNLTGYEVIALGRQPYTNWFGNLSIEDTKKIQEAVDRTQINAFVNKKCFELSDGQLQKVMIARSLAQDTNLIILDEPTTHLDMYHKAQILTLLRTLTRETGKTILFSSHEIDLAIQLCDKIIIMTEDQCKLDTPEQHIDQGNFASLFPKDLIVFDPESKAFRVNK